MRTLFIAGIIGLIGGILSPITPVSAQRITETLTIEQAIRQALNRNYGIRLARMEADIARNNNTAGIAGQLPRISTTWANQISFNNSELEFFSGEIRSATLARNTQVVGNVMADWTIYDGMRMYAAKNRLEELQKLGATRVRVMADNTIAQVVTQYYNLVVLEKMRRMLGDAITLSEVRKNFAEEKEKIGAGAGIAVLQAQTDLNADSSALILHENRIAVVKMELNQLLGRAYDYPFTVDTTIKMFDPIDVDAYSSVLRSNNPQILAERIDIEITKLILKEQESTLYPRLNLLGGLNLTHTTAQLGVLKSNLSYGPVVGLGISWNFYNGNGNRTRINEVELELKRQKLEYEQVIFDFEHRLRQTYQSYTAQLNLIALEQKNLKIAEENLEITLQQLFIGVLNELDLRQTQVKLLDSQTRLFSAQYQAKVLETELLRLGSALKTVYKAGN